MRLKRRAGAALAAAAILLSGTVPATVRGQDWEYVSPQYQTSASSNAAQTSVGAIKHVVVIFQENVSFDHYFATYPVARNLRANRLSSRGPGPLRSTV